MSHDIFGTLIRAVPGVGVSISVPEGVSREQAVEWAKGHAKRLRMQARVEHYLAR